MNQLRTFWWTLIGSLWFLPSIMVVAAIVLALGLAEVDTWVGIAFADRWPRLFGAGVDGSREMLNAIATSMITVAGVVFSVTIVALSLTASQYSPRVLRTFMNDRPTQLVLGVFLAIFAYCLVVLRTIRNDDDGDFVPSLAVLGGLLFGLVGLAVLVYFIHHLATSIQASTILAKLAAVTQGAIDDLFPQDLGAAADELEAEAAVEERGPWTAVPARTTGYVIHIDKEGVLRFAAQRQRIVRMHAGIGDFVIEGQTLAFLHGDEAVSEKDENALNAIYSLGEQRTIYQDAGYGIQQIVDIACKALSPSINDSSTALLCIDRLTQLLVRLARRSVETPFRGADGKVRVIARGPTFGSLLDGCYRSIRINASDKAMVLSHLLWSFERVGAATSNPSRRRMLLDQVRSVVECVRNGTLPEMDRVQILAHAERLQRELEVPLEVQASE